MKTPMELRTEVIDVRRRHALGQASYDELVKKAEEYIDALKEWAKRTGNKKFKIPSVAYVLRAL